MRQGVLIFLLLAAWNVCPAQQKSEFEMRRDSAMTRIMNAINTGKEDKSLASPLSKKSFANAGNLELRESSSEGRTFSYDKGNNLAGEYRQTRSFLGIKNPWIGKTVFEIRDAPLFSKSLVPGDKTAPTSVAETREFYQAGKTAPARTNPAAVQQRPFLQRGGLMGMPDQITDKLGKEMTLEEVRELLNKNR